MKRLIIWLSVLLIIGHVQLEFGSWLAKLWPESRKMYIDPWLDSSYEFPKAKPTDPDGIRLTWFIKYAANDVLLIITYLCAVLAVSRFSRKLKWVMLTFLGYHIFDHFMFWYNFKTSYWLYIVELGCNVIAVLMIIIVKDSSKVKSLI